MPEGLSREATRQLREDIRNEIMAELREALEDVVTSIRARSNDWEFHVRSSADHVAFALQALVRGLEE